MSLPSTFRTGSARPGPAAGGRPAEQLPEPGRLWVRYLPRAGREWRSWPGPGGPWLDLAGGALTGWEARAGDLPPISPEPLDDLLYLPPVREDRAGARDELARRHLERGTPVLVQLLAGSPGEAPEGATAVFDLTAPLLAGEEERLGELPAGTAAVWPLLPGLTDDPGLWRRGCERLAAAGAAVVQPLRPDLAPADRRRLAEGRGGEVFDALFHAPAPDPRAFARVAHRAGLDLFLPRPLPRPPLTGAENRRLAGLLALAGELWQRLGRPAERGQGLYRAAREADRTAYDLAALARDGNLGVLGWLDETARTLVEQALTGARPRLLEELLGEYLEG